MHDQPQRSTPRTQRATRRSLFSGVGTAASTATAAGGAAALLAACGSGDASRTDQASAVGTQPVTIEYYTGINARQQTNFQPLVVDAFQKVYPKVSISVIPSEGDFFTKLRTLVVGGTPPDVTWEAYVEAFLGNLIQDVTPYVKRDKINMGVYSQAALEGTCIWKGKILGLPNQSGGNWPVMPYNRDLFRQAGVPEPPAAWGDAKWNAQAWLDALQRTTRTGPDGRPLSFGLNQVGAGIVAVNWSGFWKTSWLSDDFKTITSDSPSLIEAVQYLVDLTTRYKVVASANQLRDAFGDNNAANNFLNGKLAMLATAGGGTAASAQAVQERGLPLAFAPLPTFKIAAAGHAFDDNGLPTGARHPEEAWAFCKWSAETPNWAISRGATPARADLFDAWAKELYAGIGPQMRIDVYKESLKYAGKLDPLFKLPTYRQIQAEIMTPAFNKLLAGEGNVATTLREIKPQLQALVPTNLG
jgi:ABC-type glycerol-3-phosphate transport system substrate-binding protein